jgi:hypothetical protein
MSLRICLVTPFAWSQPHDVNEHVAGIARELRGFGHVVTVLAPSSRASDLLAGRRALNRGEDAEVIAVGPAVQISRRSSLGVPVGVRTNVTLALRQGRFDVVHGFEPGLPSISYLALRDAQTWAFRLAARSARSSSAGSTRCSRPRRPSPRQQPGVSRATTGSSPRVWTSSSSHPRRSGS